MAVGDERGIMRAAERGALHTGELQLRCWLADLHAVDLIASQAEPSSTSRAPAASNGSAGPAASAPVDIHEDGSMLFKF